MNRKERSSSCPVKGRDVNGEISLTKDTIEWKKNRPSERFQPHFGNKRRIHYIAIPLTSVHRQN